eukprot:916052-Prymnesium_polylepis.1
MRGTAARAVGARENPASGATGACDDRDGGDERGHGHDVKRGGRARDGRKRDGRSARAGGAPAAAEEGEEDVIVGGEDLARERGAARPQRAREQHRADEAHGAHVARRGLVVLLALVVDVQEEGEQCRAHDQVGGGALGHEQRRGRRDRQLADEGRSGEVDVVRDLGRREALQRGRGQWGRAPHVRGEVRSGVVVRASAREGW